MNHHDMHHHRPLGDVIREIRDEAKEFVSTRVAIAKKEISEKAGAWKSGVIMLVIGAIFGGFALVVLTAAMIAGLALLFEGRAAYLISSGIVFVLYALIGGVMGWMGYRELSSAGMKPDRTLRVLQQDQAWLQSEAQNPGRAA